MSTPVTGVVRDVADAHGVRELRAQLRWWRRGRADVSLAQVLSDAYVAVLSVVTLGAMGISALIETRAFAGAACTSAACQGARGVLPALVAAALLGVVLAVSRLFGPMFVTPAVGSWLLPAPLDRRSLLRPRLLATLAAAFCATGVAVAPVAAVAGLSVPALVGTAVLTASACSGAVALCVLAQPRHGRLVGHAGGTVTVLVWAGLLSVALGIPSYAGRWPGWATGWSWAAGASVVAALALGWVAHRSLPALGRDRLTPGGTLAPSLSGALAVLDLALVHDVLLARRWRARSRVRPVRGLPVRLPRALHTGLGSGLGALVVRDLVRLRRSPRPVVVLAGSLVLPHLAATLGLGRATLLVTATTGFVAGLGLFVALRVLARSPALVRFLPQPPAALLAAATVVPATVVVGWGAATAPALHAALAVTWPTALGAGVAVGAVAVAAASWWMTGKPPDYQMPLVSSPGGAVPPALLLAATRGLDVVVLGVVPLMVFPSAGGIVAALVVATGVLWWRCASG